MAEIPGTITVTASIAPTDTGDTYETHREEFGKGGFRTVSDFAGRDAISAQRRIEGMWVHVLDNGVGDDEYWTLIGGIDNVNWQEVIFSTGGGVDEFTQLTDTPNNYSGQDGKFIQVDETANELIFVDSSGGVETWIPLEGITPAFLEFLLSDNSLLTDVASGQLLTIISPAGNPASAGTAETFTLSGTEQGFYVQITETSPQTLEAGYLIFTDNVADWWSVGGAGSGVFYNWDTDTLDYRLEITFTAQTFSYQATFHHPDILDREICISTFIIGDDITCNIYINDGANTPASPPTFTFTQTLFTSETAILEAALSRVVNSQFENTTTTNYRSIPTLQYTAVTQYLESGTVDPSSYPADNAEKLFMVTGLSAPLLSTAGIIDNGYAVGFDDVSFLKTRTVDATDTVFDVTLDYNQEGIWSFLDTVRIDGAFEGQTPLFSKDDDLFNLQNHTKYLLTFTTQGLSTISMTLPDVFPQENTLFPFVDIQTAGKDKSVNINTDDGSFFFVDGVDTGSAVFTQGVRETNRYIRTSVEGQSGAIWQVISFATGGGFDDSSLVSYISSAGISLNTTGVNALALNSTQDINLTPAIGGTIRLNNNGGEVLLQLDPISALGVATKQYVDASTISNTALENYFAANQISLTAALNNGLVLTTSGTGDLNLVSGDDLNISSSGITDISATGSVGITSTTSAVVITSDISDVIITGGTELAQILVNNNPSVSKDPTIALGIATKQYVDNISFGSYSLIGTGTAVAISVPSITALTDTDIAITDDVSDFLRTYRFDGTNWAQVGNSFGFPNNRVSVSITTMISGLTPRIAYYNSGTSDLITYDFDGTNWSVVGNAQTVGAGSGDVAALNSTDVVHINNTGDLLQVYRFDGVNWDTLGTPLSLNVAGPTMDSLTSTDIVIADSQFDVGPGNFGELRVYRFNGATWTQIGSSFRLLMGIPRVTALSSSKIAFVDTDSDTLTNYNWDGSVFTVDGQATPIEPVTGFADVAGLNASDIAFISNAEDLLKKFRFSSPNEFDENSLEDYNANFGVQITAATNSDINMVTSGTGAFLLNGSPISGFDNTSLAAYVAAGAISLSSTGAPISLVSAQGVNITAGVADGVIVSGASLQVNSTTGMVVADDVTALSYLGNTGAPTIVTSQSGQDINITSVTSDMTLTVPLVNTLKLTNGNATVDMTSSGILTGSTDPTDSFVFDISTAAGFFASDNPLGFGGSHLLGAFTIGNQQVVGGTTAETVTTLGSKTSMTVDSETVLTTGSKVDLRISETGGTVHASMIMAYDGTAGGGTLDLTSESDMSLTSTSGLISLTAGTTMTLEATAYSIRGDIGVSAPVMTFTDDLGVPAGKIAGAFQASFSAIALVSANDTVFVKVDNTGVVIDADPTVALGVATKQYVDGLGFTDTSLQNFVASSTVKISNSDITAFVELTTINANLIAGGAATVGGTTSATISSGVGDVNVESPNGDIVLNTAAPGEVRLTIQTAAMNSGAPTALAVASKQYADGIFDNTSLAAYVAAAGISLTTAAAGAMSLITGSGGLLSLTAGLAADIFLSATNIRVSQDPTLALGVATKQYVDNTGYRLIFSGNCNGQTQTVTNTTKVFGEILNVVNFSDATFVDVTDVGDENIIMLVTGNYIFEYTVCMDQTAGISNGVYFGGIAVNTVQQNEASSFGHVSTSGNGGGITSMTKSYFRAITASDQVNLLWGMEQEAGAQTVGLVQSGVNTTLNIFRLI